MRTIIFSKDRAFQLHALLESIKFFDHENIFNPLVVIYDCSLPEYFDSYEILKHDWTSVQFISQTVFKADVMYQLNRAKEHVMFLVDDMLMRHPMLFEWKELEFLFRTNGDVGTVSLRLGDNTTVQYQSRQTIEPIRRAQHADGNLSYWNSFAQPTTSNWGYPLSVDGHVFRTTDMRGVLQRLTFHAPNTMEEQMSLQKSYFSPVMACQEESVFVNNPLNLVQTTHNNRYNKDKHVGVRSLNDLFVSKKLKMDWKKMLSVNEIVGSHQDMKVLIKNR